MTDRYDAVTSRKDKDGKWRSTRIGAAFPAKDGKDGFSIVLDALPMPGPDGQARIMLFPAKAKEDRPSGSTGRPRSDDMNDDVPFAPEFR
jgi:hypothetical protein